MNVDLATQLMRWCKLNRLNFKTDGKERFGYDAHADGFEGMKELHLAYVAGDDMCVWMRVPRGIGSYGWCKMGPEEIFYYVPDIDEMCCVKKENKPERDDLNSICRKCKGKAYQGFIETDCPRCGRY